MKNKDFQEGYKKAEEDLISNIELGNLKYQKLEDEIIKIKSLLDTTEKNRLNLLQENRKLKEELGNLYLVKKLMEQSKIYGYSDWLNSIANFTPKGAKINRILQRISDLK